MCSPYGLSCFELSYLNHSKNSSNKKFLYFLWFFLSAKEFLFFLIKSICCGGQGLISFHSSLSSGIVPPGRTELPTWIPGLRPSGEQGNMFCFFPENSKVILSFPDFYLKSICWKYSPRFLKFPFFLKCTQFHTPLPSRFVAENHTHASRHRTCKTRAGAILSPLFKRWLILHSCLRGFYSQSSPALQGSQRVIWISSAMY